MRSPKRVSVSVAGRCALVAAVVFVGGISPRVAWSDPVASNPSSGYTADQRAEELYLDGLEKLSAGHEDVARETFQSVIARYPTSGAAEQARRDLAELNAGSSSASAASNTFDAISVTGALPSFGSEPEEPVVQHPTRVSPPSWDRELRRNASIQSKLRVEAGDRVFFSAGSSELGSRARLALSAQAQWLMRWHEFEAAIEGHADEPGTEQENVELSQARAESVRRRLIEEGVEPNRIAIVPLGRSVRVATCSDSDCLSQNRRAVTLVFATGTRERLGLVSSFPLSTALAPSAPATVTPATATVSQTVGQSGETVGMTR